MSDKEIKAKYNIGKNTLKKIKDQNNIITRSSYLPEGTQKKSIPYADRFTAEEKSAMYKKRKATETEDDRIKARERDKKYRDKNFKESRMEPSSRTFYDDLWKDIARSANEGDRIKLVEGPKYASGADYKDFQSRVFLDTKTNETFNYSNLKQYLDSGKLEGVTYNSVIKPYELKNQIANSGLREEIQQAYFGEKYKPPSKFRAQNTFHVHHIGGVAADPFSVQLTFADENLGLVTNKKFNTEWAKLIEKNAPLSERKNYLKFVKKQIGDNIAQTLEFPEVGKTKTFGEIGTNIQKLLSNEKFKDIEALKPGTPLHTKLMKFCQNSLANGGTGGVCSIDEAITGMKNEIQAAKTGTASKGALSRTANKLKNIGSDGFRIFTKVGLLSEGALELALGFDRVISEGEPPIQALRKSWLTAPLQALGLMKTYEEGQREELLQNAAEKDKVEFVLDQQELINDRNRAMMDIQKLKEAYSNDLFSDAQTKAAQQKILDEKEMGIKDMYRSGELSRAENLISGFQNPQDLNIKDKSLYDAFINAQEKLSVVNAPKFIAQGSPRKDKEGNLLPSLIEERRLKEREKDEGFLNKEKIDELIKSFQLPQKTEETVDLLGGYDEIIKDAGMSAIAEGGGVANLAGGGIAKQAGDSSGPPPESGPNSQGLLSLMNRGMKI